MFIYHTGDLVYDFMTTTVADICKEQFANKHSTDPESVEAFCDSPLFFFFFVLVFVCMTGPFVLLDVSVIVNVATIQAMLDLIDKILNFITYHS